MKSPSKLVVRLLYANYQTNSSSEQKESGHPREMAQVIIVASKSIILQISNKFLQKCSSCSASQGFSHRLGNEFKLRSTIDAQIKMEKKKKQLTCIKKAPTLDRGTMGADYQGHLNHWDFSRISSVS